MKKLFGRIVGTPGAVAPLPWTPANLPGLVGWWKPDILRQAEGSPVMALPTLAGPHNTLIPPDAATAPLYTTDRGKGAILMDGGDDVMWMSDKLASAGASAITFFCLLQHTVIPTDNRLGIVIGCSTLATTAGGTRALLGLQNIAGASKPWTLYWRDTELTSTRTVTSATLPDLLPHVVIAIFNRAPAGNMRSEIWLDGVQILTNDQAITTPAWAGTENFGSYVGSRQGAGQGMFGKIWQIGMTHSAPDEATRQKIEGYLAAQIAISGQLPPAHPYFGGPPA
jgi:hypothetical protein